MATQFTEQQSSPAVHPMSSSQLRWQERFEFVIAENGRDVPATFEAHGFAIGRQPFRILIDGVLVFESSVTVKRWWPGFLLGICIGLLIVVGLVAILGVIVTGN